jgi:hypothetical protein
VIEGSLDKVLRLTGGVTKGYVHIVKGKPVTVSQYRTPHPAQQLPTGPSVRTISWGSIKVGQTLLIRAVPYRVTRVNVKSKSKGVNTGKKGTGLNTASNSAVTTAAKAAKQAANASRFGTTAQNPQSALTQGRTPGGGKVMTAQLLQVKTGQYFYVSVPVGTPVNVMG